jgi:hypothetical protein
VASSLEAKFQSNEDVRRFFWSQTKFWRTPKKSLEESEVSGTGLDNGKHTGPVLNFCEL